MDIRCHYSLRRPVKMLLVFRWALIFISVKDDDDSATVAVVFKCILLCIWHWSSMSLYVQGRAQGMLCSKFPPIATQVPAAGDVDSLALTSKIWLQSIDLLCFLMYSSVNSDVGSGVNSRINCWTFSYLCLMRVVSLPNTMGLIRISAFSIEMLVCKTSRVDNSSFRTCTV